MDILPGGSRAHFLIDMDDASGLYCQRILRLHHPHRYTHIAIN